MSHICHAMNCEVSCPPAMLMHRAHWAMVPADLQRKLYAAYRRGQERRMDPSPAYLRAAMECVIAVAKAEGYPEADILASPEVDGYRVWAERLEVASS